MARFRRHPYTEWHPLTLDGETFQVALRKMSMFDVLETGHVARDVLASVKTGGGLLIEREQFERVIATIARYITKVDGLFDEDGQRIEWHELDEAMQHELLAECSPESVFGLLDVLARVGRDETKKKASSPTSSTSPSDAPAPPAPEG